MADLVMGAMDNLIPKLCELLKEEYKLQTGMKERISSLTEELESAQAELRKVGQVPWDQLDEQVQIWARHVKEASYDMEDILDIFLVRVQGSDSAEQESLLKRLSEKMSNLWPKITARRKISRDVKDIISRLQEVTERYRKYKVDDIEARLTTVSNIDPRLRAMYTQVDKLVGIDESSHQLKSKLQLDDMSNTQMKTVSIVGIGGLGKTTLAKAVYDNLKGDFNCSAFVSVGRNPDLQKVLQMILIALDKERYEKFNFPVLQNITQFIDELREFLHNNQRYFIVIDDIWEKQCWGTLKLAIADDKSCEGRIIITTRKWEVANSADEVYGLQPLPYDSSRKLFYTRIYGDEMKYIEYDQPDEVSNEILRKCAGIPLAIITMASLLVREPRDRWFELYKSIGFGCKDNEDAENIVKKILSFSYYDLPPYLRTCLLYISAFPEDSVIPKVSLVWMWVAEGFVQRREGKGLFEAGEGYFNDLINRSLIQEVDEYDSHGCCVHDMVLDFIRSMSFDENFFTVFHNNDQGTRAQSNVVRRLAHHNKTMMHSDLANMFDMSKVRSFIAQELIIDEWAPLSTLRLLRVLNIGYGGGGTGDSHLQIEPLGQLLHLRFLGISGAKIEKIPEEIGALKFLQTLDLMGSVIFQLPSMSSLPTQLVCLRIDFDYEIGDINEMFSVGRLTSLEELSIHFVVERCNEELERRFVKELGSLRELRVLHARIPSTLVMETALIESVRHLHKLQHLRIEVPRLQYLDEQPEMEFVLPGDLRYLALDFVTLWKLPSCINPLCHRKLSHLELNLQYMDESELKTLGRLPELCFLYLDLSYSSPTIPNISDSDACYFPELRSLTLSNSLVLFIANKGEGDKKSVSFQLWDGEVDGSITTPPSVSGAELQGDNEFSSVFPWETGKSPVVEDSGDELQLLFVSDGIAMSPVSNEEKKEGSISTREGEGQDAGAAKPRFMPRLQMLHFHVCEQVVRDARYCNNLGLEFLSSLQKISVHNNMHWCNATSEQVEQVEAALRSAAQVHPNHPTIHIACWPIRHAYR